MYTGITLVLEKLVGGGGQNRGGAMRSKLVFEPDVTTQRLNLLTRPLFSRKSGIPMLYTLNKCIYRL